MDIQQYEIIMNTARKLILTLALATGLANADVCLKAQDALTETTFCSGYSANDVSGYWGATGKAHLQAAIRLDGDMLNGNRIVAMKCAVEALGKVTDCRLFIKKDLSKEENLYEQDFQPERGWNYVMFDFPFYLNGMETLYIGYELTATGQCVGYGQAASAGGAGYVRQNNGAWSAPTVLGKSVALSIGAVMAGGNYSGMEQGNAALQYPLMPQVVKAGECFMLKGTLLNGGVQTLNSFDVCYRVNGGKEVRATRQTCLLNGQTEPFGMEIEVPEGKNTLDVWLDRINSSDHGKGYSGTFAVDAYQKAFPRKALVEYYTSQGCANCPPAKDIFDRATTDYQDRMAMVIHHAGYAEDLFSIQYSWDLAAAMGINSAPAMTINREPVKTAGSSSVVFHPANMTTDIIKDATLNAALAGVSIDNVFYKSDSTLSVSVTVDKDRTLTAPLCLHVYLCENGYVSSQGSPTGGIAQYTHNHFPRASLTPLEGTPLVFDADGRATQTFVYKVPSGYEILTGGYILPSCPEKMEVTAFVAAADTYSEPRRIFNSAVDVLHFTDDTAIEPCAGSALQPFAVSAAAGAISVGGSFYSAGIYTLQGALAARLSPSCRKVALPEGIYIVKVNHAGGVSSVKVMVK